MVLLQRTLFLTARLSDSAHWAAMVGADQEVNMAEVVMTGYL